MSAMTFYVRHLPHWQPSGESIFLTWRLFGSYPKELIARLREQCEDSAGKNFVRADRELEKSRSGPHWLNKPEIAQSVVAALHRGEYDLRHYDLHAFVVMPNHVHVLLSPLRELERITNGLKGVTAREANRILGRTGAPFWQDETYDHWIRDGAQFARVRRYIEQNPVTAGLANSPSDWPWSSATGQPLPLVPDNHEARSSS